MNRSTCAIIYILSCVYLPTQHALNGSDFETSIKFSNRSGDPKTPLTMPYFHVGHKADGKAALHTMHHHIRNQNGESASFELKKKPLLEDASERRLHRPVTGGPKQYHTNESRRVKENIDKNYFKPKLTKHERSNESDDKGQSFDFVPTRMLVQMRKFERESHVPTDIQEPRLKKIVKDTRIHTVYTEEGYEDDAYDHGGEEKRAEEDSHHEETHRRRRHIDLDQFALGNSSLNEEKYPYYKIGVNTLHRNSPLRYAQNLGDVPQKKTHPMAFYEQARNKIKCDNIVLNVDPVPKEVNDEEGPRNAHFPQAHRLPMVDDMLDCYKSQLFGKTPLDNPLFMEETIARPDDVFLDGQIGGMMKRLKAPVGNRASRHLQTTGILEATPPENDISNESLPDAEALRRRRIVKRRRRPDRIPRPYSYHSPEMHAVVKNQDFPQRILSEVYYKSQIKPDEQLNVFTDVINHIQNMSQAKAVSESHSEVIASPLRHFHKSENRKFPPKPRKQVRPVFNEYPRWIITNPRKTRHDVHLNHIPVVTPIEKIGLEANVDSQYTTIDIPINKFIVPGMKPPLELGKPIIYSDFQNENILQQRSWMPNRRITRRKRAMKSYSNISRQPVHSTLEEEGAEDDDDDYVPHRSTNYHYDPATGRIVYVNKPTTESSVEDIISDYFKEREQEEEDEQRVSTTSAPTPRPTIPHRTVYHKDVLNKANGKTLVDYIMLLKSDPSYVPIADPKDKSKPKETTSAETLSSTTPPEFIMLLQMLHSNPEYKRIDDESEESKHKIKFTTEKPTQHEEEEEEKRTALNAQSSSGTHASQDNTKLQIVDINEYLPQTKTYTPRTTIDYSKYKTIERPITRHTYSSHYSEDTTEKQGNDESSSTAKPTAMPTTLATVTANIKTSSPRSLRTRATRRPSRNFTVSVAASSTMASSYIRRTTEASLTSATHRPASRVYPRRKRPRILLKSASISTEAMPGDHAEESVNRLRWNVRRSDTPQDLLTNVPSNHKPHYSPLRISKRIDDDDPIVIIQRQPRLVTPEIINYNRTTLPNFRASQGYPGHFRRTEMQKEFKFITDPAKRLYFHPQL